MEGYAILCDGILRFYILCYDRLCYVRVCYDIIGYGRWNFLCYAMLGYSRIVKTDLGLHG